MSILNSSGNNSGGGPEGVDTTSVHTGESEVLSTVDTVGTAIGYVTSHGFAVFPCRPGNKRPATKNGFHDAVKCPDQIQALFKPGQSLGVSTGEPSGVFVIDLDGETGEAELARLESEHGVLPETVTATTPRGGRHLYFQYPSDTAVGCSTSKLAKKIDIRGQGGYVVAPPSRLPNGNYAWVTSRAPGEIEVAEAPSWVFALLAEEKSKVEATADGPIPKGGRNSGLTSLAGSMRHRGMSQAAIEAALLVENQTACSPPLAAPEVRSIAASVARYEPSSQEASVRSYRPFPVDALPEPLAGYVRSGATAIGCDPSYIALLLLTGLASAIGNTRRIELKRGWSEPAILWTAIVGCSGTLKSPALEAALGPVKKRQADLRSAHDFAIEAYDANKLVYEKALAKWKKSASEQEPPVAPIEPVAARTWVDDLTIEALAMLRLQQPRRLIVACDELASWLGGFDRYAQSAVGDAARWLEMFGGRSMSVDRKTGDRRSIYVPRASVSVCGGIQPGALRRALTPQHRESGLAARLLLTSPPARAKAWTEATIDPQQQASVEQIFDRLYGLTGASTSDTEIVPVHLPLSVGAKKEWISFFQAHAAEQVVETGDLAAAWSKLEGYTARLALVLHLAKSMSEGATGDDPVSVEAMNSAVLLIDWFKRETRRVYAMLGNEGDQTVDDDLVKMIKDRGGEITARDLQRTSRRWPTSEAQRRPCRRFGTPVLGTSRPSRQRRRAGAQGASFGCISRWRL